MAQAGGGFVSARGFGEGGTGGEVRSVGWGAFARVGLAKLRRKAAVSQRREEVRILLILLILLEAIDFLRGW